MSYHRRIASFALILSIFFLSSTQKPSTHYNDSTSIVLTNLQESDSLETWILKQKSICSVHMDSSDLTEVIDLVDEMEEEMELWRLPTSKEELKAWGGTMVKRASAKEQIGDFIGAKTDYLTVLEIYKKIDAVNYGVVRYVHYPLGNIYTRLGENEQAIRFLNVYIDSSKANQVIKSVGMGYSDLGKAYVNKGESEKAIELYLEGIEEAKGSDMAMGLLMSNMSEAYLDLKNYDDGIDYGLRSLTYLNRINYTDYIAGVNITLGKIYTELGRFDDAISWFDQAEEPLLKTYPNRKHRKWGKFHQARAELLVKQGKYKDALRQNQIAFASIIPDFDTSRVENVPSNNQLYPEVVISEVLINKAKVFEKLAHSQPNRTEYFLKQALKHYECYFQMEGVHRSEHVEEASKLLLVQEVHDYGEDAIETALQLYKQTNDETWLEECVLFAERTKGIILSESNFIQTMKERDEFPQQVNDLIELESKKKSIKSLIRIARFEEEWEELKSVTKRESEVAEKIILRTDEIKKENPTLYRELFSSNELSKKDIRKYRKESENILTYYFGKKHVYCFGLNKKSVQFERVKIGKEFSNSLKNLLDQLTDPQNSTSKEYSDYASTVYKSLFKPFEKSFDGENVVIIPDVTLTQLPFEALCSKKGNDFGKLDYLVNKYSIRYAYSLKWLNRKFSETKYTHNFLGVAPEFNPPNKYSALSFSAKEVNAGKELGGHVFIGNNARKDSFLHKAGSYRILDLSTHAQMWDEDFQQASIAFYGKRNDRENHLLASELPAAKLAPELMVLSACETGKGDFIKGEGMLSLSRIFAQSGTKNIMASLWKVNHQSNSEILCGFYDTLRSDNTLSISTALTYSKRNYLEKNEFGVITSHPYYWSGMVLMGNNELNLENPSSGFNWWWLVLIVPGVIFILIKLKSMVLREKSL